MDPLTIALAAQGIWSGGKALGLWGQPPKAKAPPKYKPTQYETNWVNELERRKEEGIFSSSAQSKMLSQASSPVRQAGNVASNQIRGNITSQGLENSAVMNQATGRVHSEVIGKIAQIAKEIALKNELSKSVAENQLGEYGMRRSNINYSHGVMKTGVQNQNAMNAYNTRMSGIEGLFSTGLMAVGANQRDLNKIVNSIPNDVWITESVNGQLQSYIKDTPKFYKWLLQFDEDTANRIEDYLIQSGQLG